MHIAHPDDDVPEPRWQVRIHSQHLACEKCGRSFDTLNPHNFSFNSSLGWCTACEGLGTQTGANPAALMRDANLSLAKGALLVWPDVSLPVSQAMLAALSRTRGRADRRAVQRPVAAPTSHRAVRHGRRLDRRLPANPRQSRALKRPNHATTAPALPGSARPLFKFQYKGLYPALEEASKLAARLRALLEQFVGEIDCSECGGSRLRDDAAAVRFRERTLDQIGRTPLGDLARTGEEMEARRERKESRRRADSRNRQSPHVPGRCRPQLSHARPRGADAFRRRSATHPPRKPGRQRPVRCAVRARRTHNRPPSAR